MTIARLWRTRIDPERAGEYEAFARDVSLDMFRRQPGFLGVTMYRDGPECSVLTLWESNEAAEALHRSRSYLDTVARIQQAGFLRPPQTIELGVVHVSHQGA